MRSGEPSRISLRKRWISPNVIKLREKYIRALLWVKHIGKSDLALCLQKNFFAQQINRFTNLLFTMYTDIGFSFYKGSSYLFIRQEGTKKAACINKLLFRAFFLRVPFYYKENPKSILELLQSALKGKFIL